MTVRLDFATAIRFWRSALCLYLVTPAAASAIMCSVPSATQPTLGAAVRDLACTTIQLAGGVYPENVFVDRDVAISGAGAAFTVLAGAVEIAGSATDVAISRLAIDGTGVGVSGCWPSLLRTTSGARLAADDDVFVTNSGIIDGGCRLFADGFESAGVLAWSAASP